MIFYIDNEILVILFIINLSIIDNIVLRIQTKKKKRVQNEFFLFKFYWIQKRIYWHSSSLIIIIVWREEN